MTSGQLIDGVNGTARYTAYLTRASYLNFPKGTISDALGMMFSRKPDIEVPGGLDYLREGATLERESLESLLENINREQLRLGRIGILTDMREDTGEIYFASYKAPSILNWHTMAEQGSPDFDFVLLDESGYYFESSTMSYGYEQKFRVLVLIKEVYYTFTTTAEGLLKVDFSDVTTLPGDIVAPSYKGKTLNRIPFNIANVSHVGAAIEEPPLLDQSNISLTYYRGDADYRHSLYKQGQGTFYATGLTDDEMKAEKRLGADGAIYSTNDKAKIGFVELNGLGLPEMRESQQNLKMEALALGVTLFDKAGVESGKALETRSMVKTAPIRTIARTGAEALKLSVESAANWVGASGETKINPNTDFLDIGATPQDALILHSLMREGGMTLEDYHAYLHRNKMTDKPFEVWRSDREPRLEEI